MSSETMPATTPPAGTRLRRYLPLFVLAVAMAAFWSSGLRNYLSLQAIIDHREAMAAFVTLHPLMAMVGFVAIYATAVALSVPGAVFLTIAGGFLFGTVPGATLVVMAATIGATAVFLIARTSLGEPLAARAGPFLARLREGFARDAFSYLLALRLAPVVPFWIANLAPALLGVRLGTYVVATAIGIIPGTFAFAAIGAGLDSVIAAQHAAYEACLAQGGADCSLSVTPSTLVTPELLLGLAALSVVALLPAVLRKLRARRDGVSA